MEKFEKEIMLYLRNIVNKCIRLDKKVDMLNTRLDELREVTMNLGKACGTAFGQTKHVIQHLAETAEETREELAEYGGTIGGQSDWYSNSNIKVV